MGFYCHYQQHRRLLFFCRFCSCLSNAAFCLWYLSLAFPRKNKETLLSDILTLKALLFLLFQVLLKLLQFSCFLSKNTAAKVKHETSFQKSLQQFLLQIRESQRHKSYYFETMKEGKVTKTSEYMPNCLEWYSKDWFVFRIQWQMLILKPPTPQVLKKNWTHEKIAIQTMYCI